MNSHDRRPHPRRTAQRLPLHRHEQFSRIEVLEQRIAPATFTVTSVADAGAGSLRQAILDANALAGTDTIAFAIPAIPGAGPHVIELFSALPVISTTMVIDGYTEPGSAPNTLAVGSDAKIEIVLDGSLAGTADGLVIAGDATTVRGLAIHSFRDDPLNASVGGAGIRISGHDNLIEGNHIGTDPSGADSLGNDRDGVSVSGANNVIGGITPGARNVISSNGGQGITLGSAGTTAATGTVVRGNYIGTGVSGSTELGNGEGGISITTADNQIGGVVSGARNVISGNASDDGVEIVGAAASGNIIQGNYIGLDALGRAELGNFLTGVSIENANDNLVGGNVPGAGNVIGGNSKDGIEIQNGHRNSIQGNLIGLNATGTGALPNDGSGISLQDSNDNSIGGTTGDGNVIAGNQQNGIRLEDSASNMVYGNIIGTNAAGAGLLGNVENGVLVFGPSSASNLIGGPLPDEGNQIVGNGGNGVLVDNAGGGNRIAGNAMRGNAELGIDLVGNDLPNGVTPNDALDADTGANDLQNFPVLTSAVLNSDFSMAIRGTLTSTPNTNFTIDFYASATADGSGFGEGEIYLGAAVVTTNASGLAAFEYSPSVLLPSADLLTATATNPSGSTSEFSSTLAAPPPTLTIDDVGMAEGDRGTPQATFTVKLSRPTSLPVTVSYATGLGTATAGVDYVAASPTQIVFAPGEVGKQVSVLLKPDTDADELNETFFVDLSAPLNAVIADAQALGTILNDDMDVTPGPGGRSLTTTDPDGNVVTITSPSGGLTRDNLAFNVDGTLHAIILTGSAFNGMNLVITAVDSDGVEVMVDVPLIDATGTDLGKVKISGNLGMIIAGDGDLKKPAIKSLTVGSLGTDDPVTDPMLSEIRGSIDQFTVLGDVRGAAVNVTGKLGKLVIGGNLEGEAGTGAAILASLSAGGSMVRAATSGGTPVGAFTAGSIGSFTVKKDMNGGSVASAGNVASVNVGGDVHGGAVAAAGKIKVVKVFGTIDSDDPDKPAVVAAFGRTAAGKSSGSFAIDALKVNGNVENALILLGYETVDSSGQTNYVAKNSDGSVGKVTIGGNWISTSLVAGVFDQTGDGFGRNDTTITGDTTSKVFARIASIVIKGTATGSSTAGEHYGITAQKIAKLSINNKKVVLNRLAKDNIALGDNFRLVEV